MDTANPAWQALQAQNSLHAISTLREGPDGEGTKGPVPAVKNPWKTHRKSSPVWKSSQIAYNSSRRLGIDSNRF